MAKGKYLEWLYKNKKGEYVLYKEKKALLIGWAQSGLSDEQIAKNIGISTSTYYEWQKRFPEFAEALKVNKQVADYAVQNSLFKMATGYYVDEKTTEVEDSEKDGHRVKTKTVRRYIAPNVVAAKYWLGNRMPESWREKQIDDGGEIEDIEAIRRKVYGDDYKKPNA